MTTPATTTTETTTTTEVPATTDPTAEAEAATTDATFSVETIPTGPVTLAEEEEEEEEESLPEEEVPEEEEEEEEVVEEPLPMEEAMSGATDNEVVGSVSCPEGLLPVDGLPNCCVEDPSFLGDGACDPREPYNTEACAFDLGDCCHESCNSETAYGCDTVEGNPDEVGPFGFFCLDPRYSIINVEKCQVENREWLGDGGCDADGGYNTEECEYRLYFYFFSKWMIFSPNCLVYCLCTYLLGGWDMGDCCEETCNEEYSFYPCGVNQPYDCQNPNIQTRR